MLFRELTPAEEADFRQWARKNDRKDWEGKVDFIHPVVLDEWNKIDANKLLATLIFGEGHDDA